jgi:RNA polymerase sigma factor (sigma-70 family)
MFGLPKTTPGASSTQPGAAELFFDCARDTCDNRSWEEFLRRFAPKIKQFIRTSLRRAVGRDLALSQNPVIMGGVQENDLLQNVVMRLVANDCAAMKRFSGSTEEELLAYLAVITRSVVRDSLRWHRAGKRPDSVETRQDCADLGSIDEMLQADPTTERDVLFRELKDLSRKTLTLQSPAANRDRMIFELYFFHDLSINQIARCKGIELSKAGVEKALNRVKDRVRAAVTPRGSEAVGYE